MKRPNILILYTDHARWDSLGVSGNPDVRTPHLDRLANEGLTFSRFFVQNPVCMASRASFLTGQYPSTLGIKRNGIPVPQDAVTLPRLLKPYGYVSANIGKLHFLPHADRDHRAPHPDYGFDHLEISEEPGCYEDAYRAWVRSRSPDDLDKISCGLPPAAQAHYRETGIRDVVSHPVERLPYGPDSQTRPPLACDYSPGVTHTAFVAAQAAAYVEQHRRDTFLCVAGFHSPHPPWTVPERFIELYDPASFNLPEFPAHLQERRHDSQCSDEQIRNALHGHYAKMSEIDHHVGTVLDTLDVLDLAERTIVIFTSDHGQFLGEHLRYGLGFPHDCCTRVPFVMRWPRGIASPGAAAHQIAEAVDVLPTLLECAGARLPYHLQGRSFCPLLKGAPYEPRQSALTEYQDWKAVRTARFRYVFAEDGTEALYDLEEDPGEYRDVSGAPAMAGDLGEMRQLLLRRLFELERPLRPTGPY